jgi:hypothetical protein
MQSTKQSLALAQEFVTKYNIPSLPLGRNKAPLIPRDKGGKGHNDATTDLTELARLFSFANGQCGVGLVVGPAGYVILDVDDKCKPLDRDEDAGPGNCRFEGKGRHGSHGSDQLVELEATYGKLPHTTITRTPSGGRHIWFKKTFDTFVGRRADVPGWPECIDIAADKLLVVAPGVTTDAGTYRLEVPLEECADWPGWLAGKLANTGARTRESVDFDRTKVDADTLKSVDFLMSNGWHHPVLRKGTKWDREAYCVELAHSGYEGYHTSASIGHINCGVANIYSEAGNWPSGIYNIDELKRFQATGSKDQKVKVPEAVVSEVSRSGMSFLDLMMDLEEIEALDPPEYLIQDYLVRDTLAMLFADRGVGKSFLAIDWSMHIATGKDWQGHKVQKAEQVLYIVAEGVKGFGVRTRAWKQFHNELGRRLPVKALPMAANLSDPEEVENLAKAVEILKPSLIVIDTLARSTAGADENGARDMGIVVANADRLRRISGACVLILHHSGHQDKSRGRGSSTLGGAIDTELGLSGKTSDGRLKLEVTKQKDDEEAPDRFLDVLRVEVDGMFDVNGKQRTSLVIATGEQTGEESGEQGSKIPSTVSDIVSTLWKMQPEVDGVGTTQWFKMTGKSNTPFYNALKQAVELGLVVKSGTDSRPKYRALTNPEDKGDKIVVNVSHREANS